MNATSRFSPAHFGVLLMLALAAPVQASPILISGQLDFIELDTGGAVFSSSPAGASFIGVIDDVTAAGSLTDGITVQGFSCCTLAAGGLFIQLDREIDQDEADFANSLQSERIFNDGDVFEGVDLEGDAITSSGGRIEIGVSFLFPVGTFVDDNPANFYSVDINSNLLALFFIFEEDIEGEPIFGAVGLNTMTAVPLPATAALFPAGLIAGLAWLRRKRARS